MQAPSIGRIVHYHLIDTGKVVPAIIVDIRSEEHVDLFVMCSRDPAVKQPPFGNTWFENGVRYSEDGKAGHWTWPARVS